MNIRIETITNSTTNQVKGHCESCLKVLDTIEEGIEPINYDEAIELMLSVCERHVRQNHKHIPTIYVRKKPENT